MYNSCRSSLPPASQPPPSTLHSSQHQLLYYYPISHHYFHSAPPPQSQLHYKHYIPTAYHQIIPQNQQYIRQQRHSFDNCNNLYQHHLIFRNGSLDQHQAAESRLLSETRRRRSTNSTLNNNNIANRKDDTPKNAMSKTIVQEKKRRSINILHSMKSAADWIARTFCFCFTDDSINVIDFSDTYAHQQQRIRKHV